MIIVTAHWLYHMSDTLLWLTELKSQVNSHLSEPSCLLNGDSPQGLTVTEVNLKCAGMNSPHDYEGDALTATDSFCCMFCFAYICVFTLRIAYKEGNFRLQQGMDHDHPSTLLFSPLVLSVVNWSSCNWSWQPTTHPFRPIWSSSFQIWESSIMCGGFIVCHCKAIPCHFHRVCSNLFKKA